MIVKRGENLFVCTLEPEKIRRLRDDLKDRGFQLSRGVPQALFGAVKNRINLTMYRSGKLVIQGKEAREFVEFYVEPVLLGEFTLGYEDVLTEGFYERRIGVDESGKGDYFGPLVVASVLLDPSYAKEFFDMGVRDSKKISDRTVGEMAKVIRERALHSLVTVGPEKYNQLYKKIGNVNKVLAWGHARAIENLLMKVECKRVLLDKFGSEKTIRVALMRRGKAAQVEQLVRGEQDLAVAAASVLARDEFIRRMDRLSEAFGYKLPKGASSKVENAAMELVRKHGAECLSRVAKLHFKTTKKVLLSITT